MILIGSKAFEYHGIHLPRPSNYVSDTDLIMDEIEFAKCLEVGFFKTWRTAGKGKVFAYDADGSTYEIELLKYAPSFSDKVDTSSAKSSLLLYNMQHAFRKQLYPESTEACKYCGCIGDLDNVARAGGSSDEIYCWVPGCVILFALKKSHVSFPINWYKNIEDYHYLKRYNFRTLDLKFYPEAFEIYVTRKQEVDARISPKINLNLKNEEFFNQYKIDRLVDHDVLHKLVAVFDVPMHTKIRRDQNSAYCDKSLWDQLSLDEQLAAVCEEAMVIALERIILPKLVKKLPVDYMAAYRWAVMRICTTLTKGWFQEFAIEYWTKLKYFKHAETLECIAQKALKLTGNHSIDKM